jgi:hypothetical protein
VTSAALLYLLPALLLLAPLVLGRYPGERLLRAAVDGLRRRRRPGEPHRLRQLASLAPLPRGGALLASALAGRAPPRPAAAHHTSPRTDERKR